MDADLPPRAFRYMLNANTAPTLTLRPLVPANSQACVIIETLIDGHKALTMLDTGSTSNFVSPAFMTVHRICTFPLEQQLTLQLGCVGSCLRITHGANAQIWIGALDAQLKRTESGTKPADALYAVSPCLTSLGRSHD